MTAHFSIEEQIECIRHEVKVLERMCPHWVASSRISQNKADADIGRMKAVLETLERVRDVSVLAAGRLVRE